MRLAASPEARRVSADFQAGSTMAPPDSAPPTAASPGFRPSSSGSPLAGSSVPRPDHAEAAGAIGARAAASARPARPAADARPAAVLKGQPLSDLAAVRSGGPRPAVVLGLAVPQARVPKAGWSGAGSLDAARPDAAGLGGDARPMDARPVDDPPMVGVPADRLDTFLSAFEGDPALPGLTVALDAWVDGDALPIRPTPAPPDPAPPHRPPPRKIRLRHRRRAGAALTAPLAAAPPLPSASAALPPRRRGLLGRALDRLFGGRKGRSAAGSPEPS